MPTTTMLIEVSKCKELKVLKSFISKWLNSDNVLSVEFDDANYDLHFNGINTQYEAGISKEVYLEFWWKGMRMSLSTLNTLLEWLATDVDIIATDVFEYSVKDGMNKHYVLKSDNRLHLDEN